MKNINTSVKYSFTITLQPKIFIYKPQEQYDKTYLYVGTKLQALTAKFDLIAELTSRGNIHYHGILQYVNFQPKENLILKFQDQFRGDKIVGFVDIKQITNEDGWIEYICKDIYYTKESIFRRPVVHNGLTLLKLKNDYGPINIENYLCNDLE